MKSEYTTEKWLKLVEIIKIIANKQMDAIELRNLLSSKDEWEFITDRLTKMGLIFFKDLCASYSEAIQSSNMARDICKNQEHYDEEMKLLFKAGECVAGVQIKTKTEFENYIGFLDNLGKPDFHLATQFVANNYGEPVLFVGEEGLSSIN